MKYGGEYVYTKGLVSNVESCYEWHNFLDTYELN